MDCCGQGCLVVPDNGNPHNNRISQRVLLVLKGMNKINDDDSLHERSIQKCQDRSSVDTCFYIRSRSFSKSINVIEYPKGG